MFSSVTTVLARSAHFPLLKDVKDPGSYNIERYVVGLEKSRRIINLTRFFFLLKVSHGSLSSQRATQGLVDR